MERTMLRQSWFLVALAIVVTVVTLGAQKQTPVPVFVTSVGAANGLTDPSKDNQDTVKNLRDSIKRHKAVLVLTDKRDEAMIVLVVMGREIHDPGTMVTTAAVHVKLQFKDMEAEMFSDSRWRWSRAADGIVTQVEQWIIANRAKLTETPR
jgi:hypothetical protein